MIAKDEDRWRQCPVGWAPSLLDPAAYIDPSILRRDEIHTYSCRSEIEFEYEQACYKLYRL